jgi:hypothetical protein
VPLVGIDADGDGITLLGVASAGTKGRVTTVGADYLEYEALPGEAGTDTFTYAVEDWTGQRAVATIRVGIAARPGDSNRVVARDDAITVRPGQTVEVRVLENDTDVSGGLLRLSEQLEVEPGITASVLGSRVVVESEQAGVHNIGYTATNDVGGSGSATLSVTVDPEAPTLAPIARDVVVPPVDTVGRTSVDVDVLSVAQNPSGPISDLQVSVPSSAADVATVRADGTVTVTLAEQAQTIPYLLSNTTTEGVRAYAFISVPALGFFPPTARPRAPELRVAGGETLTIPLGEQVQVAPGRTAQVDDPTAVTATRSDGSSLVADSTTVQFTPAAGYVGPASITVPVTDRTGAGDTSARTSVITLPITVYTLDDYPPTFVPSTLEVGPGEAPVSVDLLSFTRGVEGASGSDTFTYRIASAVPAGFSASLDGTRLSVSSDVGTPKGTRGTLQLQLGYGRAGTMDVQVDVRTIASTRRTATVPNREINDAVQGQQSVVDILSGAFNPFPDQPLRIVGVTVETPGTGTASASGNDVVVRPTADLVGQMVVRVRVRDATDDSAREVAASITLRVRGKPAAPAAPRVGEVRDSTVVLSWTAPDSRGEPITGYEVTTSPGTRPYTCASTTCTIDGLTNNTEYTFTVKAINVVGTSDPSPASASARPDAVPSTPAAPVWDGFGDGWLTARWSAPETTGSPVTSYTLTISPAPSGGPATVTTSGTSYTFRGLTNGTAYSVQVRAHNRAPEPSAFSAPSATEKPSAPPGVPSVRAQSVASNEGRQIDVAWDPPATNGADILGYRLVITGGPGAGSFEWGADRLGYSLTGAQNGTEYTFELSASNRSGWSPVGTVKAVAFGVPATPGAPRFTGGSGDADPGNGWFTVEWDRADGNGSPVTDYQVTTSAGSAQRTGERSARISGVPAGARVSVSVQACNLRGCGAVGPAYTTSPEQIRTRAAAPTGLQVTPTSPDAQNRPTEAVLSWVAPSDTGGGALGQYQYQLSGWEWRAADGSVPGTSATVGLSRSGGSNGAWVTLRVRVQTDVGWSSWAEQPVQITWTEPAAEPPDPVPTDPAAP